MESILKKSGADSVLLYTSEDRIDPNFYYAAKLSRTRRLSGYLALGKGRPVLVTNALELGTLKGRKNFRAAQADSREHLRRLLNRSLGRKVGINCDYVSVNSMKKMRSLLRGRKFMDVSKAFAGMRSVKTKEEIKNIRQACRITEDIFSELQAEIKRGKTEIELSNFVEAKVKRSGAESVSFPPIIAFGRNSAVPHHMPGKTRIGEGMVLADIGVIYNGYCSDMTRMFYVGKPTAMHNHMYAVVNRARKAALGAIRRGAVAADVFNAANSEIKESYGKDMIHSLGHGLGIEVHDYPESLSPKNRYIIKDGMCVTVEPGYYQEGFGGVRIEDDIVVKNGRPVMLSRAPEKLTMI
ncbi:MAG: aminopeptidase P family protein [Candidatus Aenigmarchaeota archaeon]|nr:aminopeptidase P family protein [Candidatus Aenigmarchaeota archaeon]